MMSPYAYPGTRGVKMPAMTLPLKFIPRMIEICCEEVQIKPAFFYGGSRKRPAVVTRHLVTHLLIKHTDLTLDQMGYAMRPDAPMDHTSVIHSRNNANAFLGQESTVGEQYRLMLSNIYDKLLDRSYLNNDT